MSAAGVEPVGRKANWSEMVLEKTGSDMTGYRNERTMNFSKTLDKTGVIDIAVDNLDSSEVW